ncbi:2-C-methyl-D-erythritol 2,4-cyclodiphosphate synthase [Roseovarius azorensis]|uniref:Bifunctional enzyme IspD/IspF n=1 Tax=Roseovarius azorensis TaxID=1287727 RepID=A0A1H7W5B7_9RHOB|nr:2-C-methyl-D-erythritol 2,4-cyclodiphosphate synthase [Roseovarius azorensis]SEM16188.1 2-C-methyl-D-erythritol 2,4-cyclodiphosphate synthase [Roseovarius azorensis]
MTTAALIVAAGRGTRAGGDTPKQWQPLVGRRVIDWTLDAFLVVPEIDRIVVVLHPDDAAHFAPPPRVEVTIGGATRTASVRGGLEYLAQCPDSAPAHVLIHDVARCCIKPSHVVSILRALEGADTPAVAPAVAVTDALWVGAADRVSGAQDRSGLFRAQTPQGFDFAAILAAHRAHPGAAADDVEVARAAGLGVTIVEGDDDNLKITYPADFARAGRILGHHMDTRIGFGFDVHRFGPGNHCMLCGVAVPHNRGLQGHSDADVGMHALTDAIYGAMAMGDIGRHFPPTDPQWKGARSHVFLRHAVNLALTNAFTINNVDITLICEHPKITPHAPAMQSALSAVTGVAPNRISVKATTSERLGFTGREEGIAAQAVVLLVKKCTLPG